MSHASPNWKLLLECAKRLTAAGQSPFTRQMLIDCVRRIDPSRKEGSLNSTIQGMTRNLTGGNGSGQLHVAFESVGWGQFVLLEEAWGEPQSDDDQPFAAPAAEPPATNAPVPTVSPEAQLSGSARQAGERRIGLVGCVKEKEAAGAAAQALYRSPLFRGRKACVERSCSSWFVLSAKHGLVHPDRWLEPYEQTLKGLTPAERRVWSQEVLVELSRYLGDLEGTVFEVHAGVEYRDSGLVAGLEDRGALVEVPAEGLNLGQQLHFYGQAAEAAEEANTQS